MGMPWDTGWDRSASQLTGLRIRIYLDVLGKLCGINRMEFSVMSSVQLSGVLRYSVASWLS